MNTETERWPAVSKLDRWILVGLFLLGILSRLPFRSQFLHHWDSVNFALAIDRFDIRVHQPHPPGTFVIYVLMGRALNWLLHDPNASLVWISVLSSGFSAALIFFLVRWWFDRRTALIASLLVLSSPLLWFQGEVALTYMVEFVWVLLLLILFTAFDKGSRSAFYISAFCLGIAGGIRPNTPVFLFPLWAFLALKNRQSVRQFIGAFALMAAGVALWAIPMVMMSGGPLVYWDIMQWWSSQHLERSSSDNTLVYIVRFGAYTLYALGFALAPIGWWAVRHLRDLKRVLLTDWRAQMLACWITPGVLYFVFVHLKQAGHTFTIMPALVVVASLAIVAIGRGLESRSRRVWMAVVVLVVIGNGLFFLLAPSVPFGDAHSLLITPTWATIREYDEYVGERLEVIRDTFEAEDTVVIAASRYFRVPDFYLAEYRLTSLVAELELGPVVLPDDVNTLVLFDDSVLPGLSTGSFLHYLPLGDGESIRYVTWDEEAQVRLSQDALDISTR